MSPRIRHWVYGVVGGFIGGFAGAVDSGIALMIISPKDFNLDQGLKKTLFTVCVLGLLTGAKVSFAYLKQSPLPPEPSGDSKPPFTDPTKVN